MTAMQPHRGGRWRDKAETRRRLKSGGIADQDVWGHESAAGEPFSQPRCPICLEDINYGPDCASEKCDAGLPCGHRACTGCIIQFIEACVHSGEVSSSNLSCPMPECRKPMPDEFIAQLLLHNPGGADLHERLLDFQARRFVPEPESGECLLNCPAAGCGQVLVPVDFVKAKREVTCPSCAELFCSGCCQPAHFGVSCEDAEHERMDPELRRLIVTENWKRCPVCRHLCERASGCNFMTCPSEQCKGLTNFCYICEELLTPADHAAHYEGFEGAIGRAGPFGSVCVNRREVNLSLPTRPPAPTLSVVSGDHEGTIVLRITWAPHKSDPPTIYYRIRLSFVGTNVVKHLSARAGDPYYDMKNLQRYRRYRASVTPVNCNGAGVASDFSEVVHLHPREQIPMAVRTEGAPRNKRWVTKP